MEEKFSFLPLCVIFALLRFPRINAGIFLLLEFGPALLCVFAALPVIYNGWLPAGRIWLGGFFPAFVLNLSMFISVRIVFIAALGGRTPNLPRE